MADLVLQWAMGAGGPAFIRKFSGRDQALQQFACLLDEPVGLI